MLVGRGSSDPDACVATSTRSRRLLADGRGLGTGRARLRWRRAARRPRARWSAAAGSARRTVVVVPFLLFTGVLVPRIYAPGAGRGPPSIPTSRSSAAAHLGPDRRLARLVLERYREALTGDVRMNCDLCTYRVRLPGYEDKVGTPISLTPHGDGPARGSRRRGGPRGRRWPHRARAAPGLRPAPAVEVPAGRRRRSTCAACASPTRTARPALAGVDLSVAVGRARRDPRPQRRRQDDARRCSSAGRSRAATGTISVGGLELGARTRAEVRRRVGIVFQDSDDQLFMPNVEADVAFGPGQPGAARRRAARARRRGARRASGCRTSADRAPHQL